MAVNGPKDYDPAKRRARYLRTRKLKGRREKAEIDRQVDNSTAGIAEWSPTTDLDKGIVDTEKMLKKGIHPKTGKAFTSEEKARGQAFLKRLKEIRQARKDGSPQSATRSTK